MSTSVTPPQHVLVRCAATDFYYCPDEDHARCGTRYRGRGRPCTYLRAVATRRRRDLGEGAAVNEEGAGRFDDEQVHPISGLSNALQTVSVGVDSVTECAEADN